MRWPKSGACCRRRVSPEPAARPSRLNSINGTGGNAHLVTDRPSPDNGRLDGEPAFDLHGFDLDGFDLDGAVTGRLSSGLVLLWNSVKFANGLAEDPWQFSVEWPELQRAGLTCYEGRWLIHRGLVLQAHEVTSATDERRKFLPYASLGLSEKTCLLPTERGCRLARRIAAGRRDAGR